jgi:hypothetical protein
MANRAYWADVRIDIPIDVGSGFHYSQPHRDRNFDRATGHASYFWANAGASLLVLVAVLDVKVFFLFALGLAGIALAFEKPARYQPLATALFGIGMVVYGLAMLRTGAAPLK